MFRKILLIIFLAGCSTAKIPELPDDVTAGFDEALKASRSTEERMRIEFQYDDKILRYLSGGGYSCGDPGDSDIARVSRQDLKNVIKKENENMNKKLKASFDILNNYAKAIKEIKDESAEIQNTISALTASVEIFGNLTATPAKNIAGALKVFSVSIKNYIFERKLQYLTSTMEKTLKDTISILKLDLSRTLKAERNQAFRLWDACAREKLIFLRDVPLKRVRGYAPLGAQASIVELSLEYQKYLQKKEVYLADDGVNGKLDNILEFNDKLKKLSFEADPGKIIAAVNELVVAIDQLNKNVN